MSGAWSIDVAEARRVIAAVAAEAPAFDTAVERFAGQLDEAAASAPGTKTAAALLGLADDPIVIAAASARQHLDAATSHTAQAVDAYVLGDLEMAAQSQRSLDKVAQ